MRRVDFLGPQGVGKTTLYEKTLEFSSPARGWQTEREALIQASRRGIQELEWSPRRALLQLALPLHRAGDFAAYRIFESCAGGDFEGFVRRHQRFFEISAAGFRFASREPYEQVEQYRWFVRQSRIVAFLEARLPPQELVVSDESLTKMMFAAIPTSDDGLRLAADYGRYLPCPQAVVALVDDPKAIARKIRLRRALTGQLNVDHQELGGEMLVEQCRLKLEMAACTVAALKERGVDVLTVDGSRPLEENTEKVAVFLEAQAARTC